MFNDRKRTPMPIPENERRSSGSSEVTSYIMSPEDLAKYGPAIPSKKTLSFTRDATKQDKHISADPIEEGDIMATHPISREEYLIRRSKGEKRTAIFDSLGLSTAQYYKLLTEWGIKDMKVEQTFIDLITASTVVPAEAVVDEVATLHVEAVELSTAKDDEIERLRVELESLQKQNRSLVKIGNQAYANGLDASTQQYEQLSEDLQVMTQQRDDYKQAAEDLEAKIDKQKAFALHSTVRIVPAPALQSRRHFHVETQGSGAKVGGDLEALMRYVKGFNDEFHLVVHLNEIAPAELV